MCAGSFAKWDVSCELFKEIARNTDGNYVPIACSVVMLMSEMFLFVLLAQEVKILQDLCSIVYLIFRLNILLLCCRQHVILLWQPTVPHDPPLPVKWIIKTEINGSFQSQKGS